MGVGSWALGEGGAVFSLTCAVYHDSAQFTEVSVQEHSNTWHWNSRRIVSTVVMLLAATTGSVEAQGRVRLGIEVLLADSMHLVRGKRVGLIRNRSC